MNRSQRSRTIKQYGLALGAVAISIGAIVMIRSTGHADHPPTAIAPTIEPVSTPTTPGTSPQQTMTPIGVNSGVITLSGPNINGAVKLSQTALMQGAGGELFAEVTLGATGSDKMARQPVSLAVVLDRSGSMSGQKIVDARNAVISLAQQMHDDDEIAVVVYDHESTVIQSLARVGDVRREVISAMRTVVARGGTKIPSALRTGAHLLSSAAQGRTRRIVLLSDGQDGSGMNPTELNSQVRSMLSGGASVSTLGIGIGYNEQFMTTVADAGQGNYEFLADASRLSSFLSRELDEASSTVARDTEVVVTNPPGMRLTHAHGVERTGQRLRFGPLFAGRPRRAVLRFETTSGTTGSSHQLGFALKYNHFSQGAIQSPTKQTQVAIVNTAEEAQSTMVALVASEARATHLDSKQAEAVELWRAGRAAEAQRLAQDNLAELGRLRRAAPMSARIQSQIEEVEADNGNFATVAPRSSAGAAYGLRQNSARRARAMY